MKANDSIVPGMPSATTDRRSEMAEFDALPWRMREALRYAPVQVAAFSARECIARRGVEEAMLILRDELRIALPGWMPDM